ncbi:MAG: GGDEF domain-containing protein [Kiritimatiellales bacterium]
MPDRLQHRLAEIGAPADVRKLAAQLAEQAVRDPLTGLYNRRIFDEALAQNIEAARRYGRELSLVLFDLDGFKRVNDTLGHQAGDEVLKFFAKLLQETARKADVVCRIGGDEFAVILPETGLSNVWKFTERVFRGLEILTANGREWMQIETPPLEGCPQGGAGFPRFGKIKSSSGAAALPAENLFAEADSALRAAKPAR